MGLQDQLQRLYEDYGRLTADIVLNEARDTESPLHSRFEWDDTEAAEKYRLQQARQLIRSVRVVYKEGTGIEGPRSVRAYQSIPEPDGQRAYRSTEEILRDPIAAQLLLRDMERDWKAFQRRYGNLEEWWKLIQRAIDERERREDHNAE